MLLAMSGVQCATPFTKQPITLRGQPASKKIRASALKAPKDLVQ
jgi:hypothetical protein